MRTKTSLGGDRSTVNTVKQVKIDRTEPVLSHTGVAARSASHFVTMQKVRLLVSYLFIRRLSFVRDDRGDER
jgi:hypothetical protein